MARSYLRQAEERVKHADAVKALRNWATTPLLVLASEPGVR
jgi:hypothetical protein